MARKILLADDSVTAQNMGRRILSDAGYEVITVNNGSAALKKIAEHKPDLIVLDVYMPGYGGLEVCQRLKESRETARIPVLLTVGKLEPFKPEEARRARADAFIVKPFEASELLTALTRLEEKIVPQPEPYKPGRFAKAIAAVEQITDDAFGDKETGWKERLKIPPGRPKGPGPEPEPAPSTSFRDLERGPGIKPAEPSREFERPLPAGLPQDITPEEIAAISAAAAAFSAKTEAQAETSVPPRDGPVPEVAEQARAETTQGPAAASVTPETPPDVPPVTFASAPEMVPEVSAVATEVSPAHPQAEVSASSAVSQGPAAASETPVPAVEERSALPVEPQAPAPHKPADAEVLAALASLMPVLPADGEAASADIVASGNAVSEKKEETPATLAEVAAASATASGPRWIAEEVPVEPGEASLVLEQEMEKAYAAMAAAQGAAVVLRAAPEVSSANLAVPTAISPTAEFPVASPQVFPSTTESAGTPSEAAIAGPIVEKQPEPAPAAESAAVSSVTPVAESTIAEPREGAALAAAACAGPGITDPAPPETAPSPSATLTAVEPACQPASHKPEEPCETAEENAATAAAWANWRQIRDSVVGCQLTSEVTDAAAGGLKKMQEAADSAAADPAEAASATEPADPNAIASIVDSVLAELKPKLVEEIARKMGDEKKKKD